MIRMGIHCSRVDEADFHHDISIAQQEQAMATQNTADTIPNATMRLAGIAFISKPDRDETTKIGSVLKPMKAHFSFGCTPTQFIRKQ